MSGPVGFKELLPQIQEIYRPSLRGHWQRRVVNRVRRWLDRDDAEVFWTEEEEEVAPRLERLPLPGRQRPPRWLSFAAPLGPGVAPLAQVLASHLATVAGLMEAEAAPREAPARWRSLLTQRQAQVALMAADGITNDEIALELGIAPRTVARLLQETFLRLGITNRQALAAECALGRPPTPFVDSVAGVGLSSVQASETKEES